MATVSALEGLHARLAGPSVRSALLGVLLGSLATAVGAEQPRYHCTFANGSTVQTDFPCDAKSLQRFGHRFYELYPSARDEKLDPDGMKNLYVMALGACAPGSAHLTPEEIGRNSEPFLPWPMAAAMARAARETTCPAIK